MEREQLDESKFGGTSLRLASALFRSRPELRSGALMEVGAEPDGMSLYINVSSPTGDPEVFLGVFLDETAAPSVGFGPRHSHGNLLAGSREVADQIAAVVDIVDAVFRDEFVLISDIGGEHPGHTTVLDLRDSRALAEELTSRYSPGAVRIRSWSGAGDQEASLETISIS